MAKKVEKFTDKEKAQILKDFAKKISKQEDIDPKISRLITDNFEELLTKYDG